MDTSTIQTKECIMAAEAKEKKSFK